jgi:hypothetical protein
MSATPGILGDAAFTALTTERLVLRRFQPQDLAQDVADLKSLAPSDDMIGVSWQPGGMRPTAYRRNARGLRDRQAFEGVRLQAEALLPAGRSQAEVARQL